MFINFIKNKIMSYDKSEIMHLDADEKRELAFELLDSIDEEFIQKEVPEWKRGLIRERIRMDKEQPDDALSWDKIKEKYKEQ
jgi:hypothetical protein